MMDDSAFLQMFQGDPPKAGGELRDFGKPPPFTTYYLLIITYYLLPITYYL
jgi:hypothetical protein